MLWAACNGSEELVQALFQADAHSVYTNAQGKEEASTEFDEYDEQGFDPFVKPKDARKVGRYTPLHWASYKGHYNLVCKFLKAKMSPLEIDMYGNTAVHQAAAAGNLQVLKCFLSIGVDVDVKNARLHTPMDLATEVQTKALISKATKTKVCEG